MNFLLSPWGCSGSLPSLSLYEWRVSWRIKHLLPSGPYLKVALPHFSLFSLQGPQLCPQGTFSSWECFWYLKKSSGRILVLSFTGTLKNRMICMALFRNHFETTWQTLASFCDRIFQNVLRFIATSTEVVSETTFWKESHRTEEILSS